MTRTLPRYSLALVLATAGLLAGMTAAEAQTPPAQTAAPASPAAAPARVQIEATSLPPVTPPEVEVRDNAIHLSLDQAIAIAVRQNLGLVIQRYVRQQSLEDVFGALGIYDLQTDATLSTEKADLQSADPLQPTNRERQTFNFGFSQNMPWGGGFSIGLDNTRTNASYRAGVARDVPTTYSSGLNLGYVQPLLRNFGRIPTERGLLIARLSSQISREEFERQVTLTVQQVIDAYWNLVGAQDQLGVAQESLGLAKEFHERNRIQVEVGTVAPLDLVQSEASIAEREEGIISSQAAVGDATDQLRRLLNLPPGRLWDLPIQPTTEPQTEERPEIDIEDAVHTAFTERPELRQQQLAIDQSRINAAYYRNQMKPRLDLSLGYGTTGAQTQFSDVLSQIFGFDFIGWSAQLQFGYPLQNRAARALSARANIEVERTNTELSDLQEAVRTEVRQAARRVETAYKTIDAARASVRYSEKNLEAERKRYENGMSTPFQITQIQDSLTLARSREVNAIISYRTALTDYYRAIGRLLEREGIDVVDPEQAVRRFTLF